MSSTRYKLPLKVLIPVLVISIIAIGGFAASVSVSPTTIISGQAGVVYYVTGGFTATSNGFQVVRSDAAATSIPADWTPGGIVNTALTQGDWYYQVTLTIAANATTSHTFMLTVQWDTGNGYATLGSSLTFTTPGTITAGQTMIFQIDTGVTSFNTPAAITVTVA